MPFYVLKRQPGGEYLSMRGDGWVRDIRDAVVYTSKSTATSAIRRAWQGNCMIERIARLPDRAPRTGAERRIDLPSTSNR
jgi:hypothetical protein